MKKYKTRLIAFMVLVALAISVLSFLGKPPPADDSSGDESNFSSASESEPVDVEPNPLPEAEEDSTPIANEDSTQSLEIEDGASSSDVEEDPSVTPVTGWLKSGSYTAGTHIPTGSYVLKFDEENLFGYMAVSDKEGETLSSCNFRGCCFISLEDGQSIHFTGAELTSVESFPGQEVDPAIVPDGMYRIGTDLPAGSYVLQKTDESASSGCYYILSSDKADRPMKDTDTFAEKRTITVEDGQYLQLAGCTASLVTK